MADHRTLGPPTTPLEIAQHSELLELDSQIRSLNAKISAAVDHAADLQDELRSMRAAARQRDERDAAAAQEAEGSGLRSMSTYFTGRRASGLPVTVPPRSNSMLPNKHMSSLGKRQEDEDDISEKLKREMKMRLDLEAKYKRLQDESEVLSQSLFEEANQMVAAERKLNHVATVKLQLLQDREADRKQRLEELEAAVGRIQRVRSILNDGVVSNTAKSAVKQ